MNATAETRSTTEPPAETRAEASTAVPTESRAEARVETLYRRLMRMPAAGRRRLVREDEAFAHPELCRRLLTASGDRVFRDPVEALALAELTVELADRLGDLELVLLARLELANALRVRGETGTAEREIRRAEALLAELGAPPQLEGRLCQVRSSLATVRHRFAEALELADRAVELFRRAGASKWESEALVGKSHLLSQAERPSDALRALREALPLLDPESHLRLFVIALHNLVNGLNALGYTIAARSLLADLQQLHERLGDPLNLLRFRWLEGRILRDLGQLGKAEEAFSEAQRGFVELDLPYNSALVALDLAEVYLQQSRSFKLRELVRGMFPIFQSRNVHREALAALILFRESVALHTADLDLVRRLAGYLEQAKHNPKLRFLPPG